MRIRRPRAAAGIFLFVTYQDIANFSSGEMMIVAWASPRTRSLAPATRRARARRFACRPEGFEFQEFRRSFWITN